MNSGIRARTNSSKSECVLNDDKLRASDEMAEKNAAAVPRFAKLVHSLPSRSRGSAAVSAEVGSSRLHSKSVLSEKSVVESSSYHSLPVQLGKFEIEQQGDVQL